MAIRRLRPWTVGLLSAAFASAGVGLVTAQEPPPPVQTPPEETTPDPAAEPAAPTDPAIAEPGETPTAPPVGIEDPAPYTVLGPDSRRAQAEADAAEQAALEEELEEPAEPGPPPPPPRRPRHGAAIVQALDKVTAETLRFEVTTARPVRYKSLVFRLNGCETEAVNEPLKEAVAHLSITSQPRPQPGRVAPEAAQVFRGWMFASSPGLNPLEHPVYDAWLIACKASAPVAPGGAL